MLERSDRAHRGLGDSHRCRDNDFPFPVSTWTLWRWVSSMSLVGLEAAGEGVVASGRCAAKISEERCNALRVVVEEF